VAVVNQDRGATIGSKRLDVGHEVQAGLLASPGVSHALHLDLSSLSEAEQAMGRDARFAAVVIPPDFTADLFGVSILNAPSAADPQIEILTNQRAGTVGVQLATGILLPALAAASHQIGHYLTGLTPAAARTGATKVILADPVTITTAQYRALPPNTGLGVSAYYIAVLTLICGFLAGTIVNSLVDSALGYTSTEIGPWRSQRQPMPVNRWQTLLIKWVVVAVLAGLLSAVVLVVAAGALGMDAPHPVTLWLFTWLCAASVAVGTIVLFAIAGTFGQLIGILIFVYAGFASAGGTVPVQAFPGFFRTLSNFEPLRQVLAGTRSILYFNAQADAGLTRGTVAAGLGLLLWLLLGTGVVKWYDRKRFYRVDPDLLAPVSTSVRGHQTRRPLLSFAPSGTIQAPDGKATSKPQEAEHVPSIWKRPSP
jgi:hypothetical protein